MFTEQTYEKLPNIISYQGNANKAPAKYQYTPTRLTEMKKSSFGKDSEQLKHTLLVEVWIGSSTLENYQFLIKLNLQLHSGTAIPPFSERSAYVHQKTSTTNICNSFIQIAKN